MTPSSETPCCIGGVLRSLYARYTSADLAAGAFSPSLMGRVTPSCRDRGSSNPQLIEQGRPDPRHHTSCFCRKCPWRAPKRKNTVLRGLEGVAQGSLQDLAARVARQGLVAWLEQTQSTASRPTGPTRATGPERPVPDHRARRPTVGPAAARVANRCPGGRAPAATKSCC